MALSRASSLPALAAGDSFWSEGANLRLQVAVARPRDLPAPSDDELEERQPLGRGRVRSRSQLGVVDGEASRSRAEVQTGASRTSFATALRTPTSWITSKKHENQAGQSSQLHREGGYESQRDTAAHGTESGVIQLQLVHGVWAISRNPSPDQRTGGTCHSRQFEPMLRGGFGLFIQPIDWRQWTLLRWQQKGPRCALKMELARWLPLTIGRIQVALVEQQPSSGRASHFLDSSRILMIPNTALSL